MKSKAGKPGTRAPAARCMVCDTWTVWAKDGTIILKHKKGCAEVQDDAWACDFRD